MNRECLFRTAVIGLVALAGSTGWGRPLRPFLINGTVVPAGTENEVVQITTASGATCTATIVGKQTIITSASCVKQDQTTATFKAAGTSYTAKITIAPLFSTKDLDIALGLTTAAISGVSPATVGGAATTNQSITLFGYGCTQSGQTPDGQLRSGTTVITGFNNYYMVSGGASGAIMCFGDGGGPAYITQNGNTLLLGVNALGNAINTNYSTRLDMPDSQSFLTSWAQTNNTGICGIAGVTCGTPPPPPEKPTCTLTATPTSIQVGGSITLSLVTTNAVSATIDGQTAHVPNDQKTIQPTTIGTLTSTGIATGSTGLTATCTAQYVVSNTPPPPPTDQPPACNLTATPSTVYQNDVVTLELTTTGDVAYASVDGVEVPHPDGKKLVTAVDPGDFSSIGFARGTGGSTNCFASFHVNKGVAPPPIPNFAVVPSYCGPNTAAGSSVQQVCWAVIKKDATMTGFRTPYALLITYSDGTKETMLIASHLAVPPASGATTATENLQLYAGTSVPSNTMQVLDTRAATLTKQAGTGKKGTTIVPLAIQGETIKKQAFTVQLTPVTSSNPAMTSR